MFFSSQWIEFSFSDNGTVLLFGPDLRSDLSADSCGVLVEWVFSSFRPLCLLFSVVFNSARNVGYFPCQLCFFMLAHTLIFLTFVHEVDD